MTQTTDNPVAENQLEYYEERVVETVDNTRTRRVLAALIVFLLLLLVGVGWFIVRMSQPLNRPNVDQLPDGIQWVRSIYAWGPTADALFVAPVDAAVGPNGRIWVSTNAQRLAAFEPDGRPIRLIAPQAGMAPGQVVAFEGIAVAENGDLYVVDYGRREVQVYSSDGERIREFKTDGAPNEIDVRGNRVAIATIGGVELRNLEGRLISKWGERGSGEANVDSAHGILIGPDGVVYLSDTNNARVRAYTPQGKLLWSRGARTSDISSEREVASATVGGVDQVMQIPAGMTFDNSGRLLVVDPFEFQILVFDPKTGVITQRYGEFGAQDGKFAYPTGIDYDPQRDVIVVADTANNRVQIIRIPGTGGSLTGRLAAGVADQPVWICAIPLGLLLLAVVLAVLRRRRARDEVDGPSTLDAADA